MQRGMDTISYIKNTPSVEIAKISMDKLLKEDKISDLMVLSFLAEQLIKMGKLSLQRDGEGYLNLFEVFLGLALLFGADQFTSERMLQTCLSIITAVRTNAKDIDSFEEGDVLERLMNNQLFRWMWRGLDFNTDELNTRKDLITQI